MKTDWPMRGVDDVRRDASDGLATGPFGSSVSSKYFATEGVPLIRGSNLSADVGDRLLEDEFVFVTEAKAAQFSRAIARRGDLVFTCWGTIGQVGLVDDRSRFDRYLVSNKQMKLSPDPLKADSLFLYYLFSSPLVQGSIQNMAIGSSVPGFNLGQLRGIRFPLPPIDVQRAIARTLGSLDDKIEKNRRTGRKLEGLARAVFKAWFVDFEPVKAKAGGATAFPGMPPETFAALPTRLVDSAIGRSPESWPVLELSSVVDAVKGLSYKGAGLAEAFMEGKTLPLHSLNAVYEGGGYKYEGIKYYSGEYKDRHIVHPGDVIIANTEQGFEYRLIGFPAIVPKRFGSKGLFTHHIFRLRPRADSVVGRHFLYYALLGGRLRDEVCGRTNGTTVNSLAVDGLQRPKLCIPPSEVADAFESMAASMHQLIENSADESEKLAALRDYLLPRLLSGRVRVGEVASVGEA